MHEEEDFHKFWKDKVDMIAYQKMNDLPDLDSGITIKDQVKETESCTFPFKQLVVDHGGDILPCCKMSGKKLALGNIKNMTLKNAWNSNNMKSLNTKFCKIINKIFHRFNSTYICMFIFYFIH